MEENRCFLMMMNDEGTLRPAVLRSSNEDMKRRTKGLGRFMQNLFWAIPTLLRSGPLVVSAASTAFLAILARHEVRVREQLIS